MFRPFLDSLRRHGVPASLREYLDLMAGMQAGLSDWTPEGFYHLARVTLVKNESHIDRFDRAFAETFAGLDEIPVEALRSPDQKASIPPLHGALLKNEQDVHLFERLVFMAQRNR